MWSGSSTNTDAFPSRNSVWNLPIPKDLSPIHLHQEGAKGRPLKVALFSDSAFPVLNGVSMSIDLLMRSLREKGHEVHLWTTRYPGHRDTDPHIHRLLGAFTPFAQKYPLAFPPFYPWFRGFREGGFDLVHTHTPFTVGFVGLRWAESAGLPIVSTYHTHYDRYSHYVPILPQPYVRFKIAKHTHYYYNQVDAAITPSKTSRDWLAHHSVEKPIHVVPTGIQPPPNFDRGVVRAKLGLKPDQTAALYVGRMAPEKNLVCLLEAASLAMAKDPSLMLLMVGDGPFIKEAAHWAQTFGIAGRVRIEGAKPRSQVDEYYAASDLFFFASVTETQGLVVLEAMSHGLPAILAVGGGASDPVTHQVSGLVTPNSARDLAEALARASLDMDLRRRLSDGAKTASLSGGVDAMTESILDIYRGVLASAAPDDRPGPR
jgi:1,2-diacylglycerol 3-alpha-glucosyltransferase